MTARLTASACVMAVALFAQAAGPLRVAPGLQASRLIYAPRPEYPKLARQMRISGRVRLAALIGRDGTVQELRLISGHPLLVPPAMNAVKRWRYRPARQYGRPVEVFTTIDIHFTLDSAPSRGAGTRAGVPSGSVPTHRDALPVRIRAPQSPASAVRSPLSKSRLVVPRPGAPLHFVKDSFAMRKIEPRF